MLTLTTSAPGIIRGENATHTGQIAGFTGEDAQFTPSAVNQTITIEFEQEVSSVSFALYDVDRQQRIDFSARNNGGALVPVTLTPQSLITFLPITSGTAASMTAVNTNYANNVNTATVTVSVAGPVKRITMTVATLGSDAVFWLSDINACVPNGVFPTNYHRDASETPFDGQVPYFIATPDNQSAYLMDTLGRAWHLFTDAQYGTGTNGFINSFAYDYKHHLLYYVAERGNADSSVKTLKRYNFNTNTIQVIGDLEVLTGIPMFEQGIQSGGAAFYDDALYIGIEGGRHLALASNNSINTSVTRESIIWRIPITDTTISSFATYRGAQVWAMPAYTGLNSLHDWGDFLVRDGVLIDFNTARQGNSPFTYPNSAFHHYNLITGDTIQYSNPAPTTNGAVYAGQAALDWFGNVWVIRTNLLRYNMNGTMSGARAITTVRGPAWVGSAGDASEPFRPRMDFGDAPAAYEPNPLRPAVHDINPNLLLGASNEGEWVKSPSANAYINADADGAEEDGISSLNNITRSNTYLANVRVLNNTGAPATLFGWIDLDRDNVFEPSEAASVIVPSMATPQNIDLFWPNITNTLPNLTTTYLRLRITSQSNGMTTASATGYFSNGEVEDYLVNVDKTLLADNGVQLDATRLGAAAVQLKWQAEAGAWAHFVVQRSADGRSWHNLRIINGKDLLDGSKQSYQFVDSSANASMLYYRLQLQPITGNTAYTDAKKLLNNSDNRLRIVPNPVVQNAMIQVDCKIGGPLQWWVYQQNGQLVTQGYQQVGKGTNWVPLSGAEKLAAGVYVVVLQDAVSTRHSMFVKR